MESVVIGLQLCPFARKPFIDDRIRFVVSEATSTFDLLVDLHAELDLLNNDESIETTLLIHPEVLNDFADYNDFLPLCDALIEDRGYEGVIQVASFHPFYQFADTPAEDVTNYTNRSPYPMLHLIREESITRALETFDDIDQVPVRNQERLRELGLTHMKTLLLGL